MPVLLVHSVHSVLLAQKTKRTQKLNNPGVRSLTWARGVWDVSSRFAAPCLLPGENRPRAVTGGHQICRKDQNST